MQTLDSIWNISEITFKIVWMKGCNVSVTLYPLYPHYWNVILMHNFIYLMLGNFNIFTFCPKSLCKKALNCKWLFILYQYADEIKTQNINPTCASAEQQKNGKDLLLGSVNMIEIDIYIKSPGHDITLELN